MSITSEYQAQMAAEHSGSKWGSSAAKYSGDKVLQAIRTRPYVTSVLDFGCGKQSLQQYIQEALPQRDIHWTNYDPGIPGIDTLPNDTFDLVVSTDVLEHVEPKLLDETLKQLNKLTGKVLVSDIACYPTGKKFMEGPYKGIDMHLTVKSPKWWRELFSAQIPQLQELTFEHIERRNKGSIKTRCFMINERV